MVRRIISSWLQCYKTVFCIKVIIAVQRKNVNRRDKKLFTLTVTIVTNTDLEHPKNGILPVKDGISHLQNANGVL